MSSCFYKINGEYKCKNIEGLSTISTVQKFDDHPDCIRNAFSGNCDSDKNWMNKNCPNTCQSVAASKNNGNLFDDKLCDDAAANNFCVLNPQKALMYCAKSCTYGDKNQNCKGWADIGECLNNPNYMLNMCKASCSCYDKNKDCQYWAKIGECKKNPNYMIVNCAKSCNSCPTKN